MRPVVVHHVVNESVELVESAFARMVFIFQPQVPFADMKRFISCPTQHIGQRDGIGVEIAPAILHRLANHARHTDPVRVTSGQQ